VLYIASQNATEELKRLESAFNLVRQGIFTRLHDVVRDQIFLPQTGAQMTGSTSHLPEAATLAEANPPPDTAAVLGKAGNGSSNGTQAPRATSEAKR